MSHSFKVGNYAFFSWRARKEHSSLENLHFSLGTFFKGSTDILKSYFDESTKTLSTKKMLLGCQPLFVTFTEKRLTIFFWLSVFSLVTIKLVNFNNNTKLHVKRATGYDYFIFLSFSRSSFFFSRAFWYSK